MLPAEAPCAYSIAVPSRKVFWQHVGDLRPLDGSSKEKWPACAGARMRNPELVCRTASHRLHMSSKIYYCFMFSITFKILHEMCAHRV